MKISCAVALLAVVASVFAASPSSESQKPTVVPSPVQQQQLPAASYPGPVGAQFPAQSYQFSSEYNYGPFGKSAYAPRSAAVPASSFGSYQPYQQQQQSYNFGPYQQQQSYYPGSGYPAAAAGSYPTAYSSQSTGAASYPTPYSAYPAPYTSYPYPAQPYHSAAAYPSYPGAYQPYNGQFVAGPSSSPYNNHYAAAVPSSSVTPYSALPSAYQQQHAHPSFYGSTGHPSQQYQPSAQQYQPSYPSFYNGQNSPAAASVVTAAAADSTITKAETK